MLKKFPPKKHWKDEIFFSDYPITQDTEGNWIQGIVRRFKLLAYDGNKYAEVLCLDEPGGYHEFKVGYLCRDPELTRYIRRLELMQIEAGTKKHVRLRQVKKTEYEVHALDAPGMSFENRYPVNTLKEARRVVRRISGSVVICRERTLPNGVWESGPFKEFSALTQRWIYRKNTGKPGPRVREFER